MTEQLANTIGTFSYDNLFAGGVQSVNTTTITVEAGQLYLRGSVVAKKDDGKAVLVDSVSADDDAKVPYGILTDDVDATGEDVGTTVYLTGEFNQSALIFGGSDTYDVHEKALRNIGIFLKSTMGA